MTSDARQILADFIQRELAQAKALGKLTSERKWAKHHGLRSDEVARARLGQHGMSIDVLERFASALGVEPWQLLFPNFERGSPLFPTLSAEAISVAQELDKIPDDEQRRVAAAAIVNLLGRRENALPASAPAEPVEPPKPSPATMRRHARSQ